MTYHRLVVVASLKLQIDLLVQQLLDLNIEVLTNLRVRHRFIVGYVMFFRLSLLLSDNQFLVYHTLALRSVLTEETTEIRSFLFAR